MPHIDTIQLQSVDGHTHVSLHPMTASAAATCGQTFASIDPWVRYPISPGALIGYLSACESDAPRYALQVDGVLAGALGMRKSWLKGPYLQFFGVLPEFQRHGLGRMVLDWLEADARASGERNLWVAASSFNHVALHFYERQGYERVAVLDDLVCDGMTEILLRKRLTVKK
jgi:ribosomal protein S18 acetylase RimI-like enzyme